MKQSHKPTMYRLRSMPLLEGYGAFEIHLISLSDKLSLGWIQFSMNLDCGIQALFTDLVFIHLCVLAS